MATQQFALEMVGLTKTFGDKAVLRGVDLQVRPGEVMFIVGTSGVGKSVTIKHVIGLLRADGGEIRLFGERIDDLDEAALYPVRMQCAMVFQHATLFDSMTLAENVALPLHKHRRPDPEGRARALLAEVGLAAFADEYPTAMGDGMRKRAAIARALSLEPKVVLFDEPTTGLDPVSARRIDRLIRGRADDHGTTAVVVSHDLTSIFTIADRIAMIYQGKVHALGSPAELRHSPDPVVRQFLSGESSGPMETPGF